MLPHRSVTQMSWHGQKLHRVNRLIALTERAMRSLLTISMLIAFTGGAFATPSPYATPRTPAASDSAIYLGPAGAMLEADYFHAPQPRYGARRVFPCQLRLHAVERVHSVVQFCE